MTRLADTKGKEPLVTLREIAAQMGRSRKAVGRLLARLYDEDSLSKRPPDWRVWNGRERSKMLFNVKNLRKAHPELFALASIDRAEFGSIEERATALELELRRARHRIAVLERAIPSSKLAQTGPKRT